MAVIDGLLKLIATRGADALTLVAGQVPALVKDGATVKLSMPPLDAGLFAQLLDEVAPELALPDDDGAEQDIPYAIPRGDAFTIRVARRGGRLRISARPGGRGPGGPAAAAKPAVTAAASPAVTAAVSPAVTAAASPAAAATVANPAPVTGAPSAIAPVDPRTRAEFDELLREAERAEVSDLLLSSGRPARLRVRSELVELSHYVFDEAQILALVELDGPARETLRQRGSVDRSLDRRHTGGLRFRVNVFRQHHGLAAALRPIRREIPTLEALRLPRDLVELTAHLHGMVLMAGPTGAGKSTTLAALIEHINRTRAQHVITLEDPIEYEYVSRRALIHQREVGRDLSSFAVGLRAALRESPDVILLGELRDAETMAAALTAAETGHLVLSTLHAPSGPDAIDRIIDAFAPHQQRQVRSQLAAILRAVVTQHLLPAARGDGRVVVYEKMVVNRAIAAMIRDDKCHQIRSQLTTGRGQGMITLDQCLRQRLAAGEITRAAAATLADDNELVLGR